MIVLPYASNTIIIYTFVLMVTVSYAYPGLMFQLLIVGILFLIAASATNKSSTSLDRMSLAFGVANKPFTPAKPKGKGKDKFDGMRSLMAIAKYAGTGVVALSGKIAGTVFMSNGNVRVWAKPRNVRDAATQFVRGIFSGVSTAFRTLSAAQVTAWNAASASFFSSNVFGSTRPLKGNTLFQKVNNVLLSLGLTTITSPPAVAVPRFTPVTMTGAASVGSATFDLDIVDYNGVAAVPANAYLRVYATRQVGVSKASFGKSDYRLIGVYPPASTNLALSIRTDYVAKFGTPRLGTRVGIACEAVSTDGANFFGITGKIYCDVIVAA